LKEYTKHLFQEKLGILTEEKFKEIYTDKSFRNSVAFPVLRKSLFTGEVNITLTFPTKYIVTDQQTIKALEERDSDRKRILSEIKNKLVFIKKGGMFSCSSYDVNCYRISTIIKNNNNQLFYVELSSLPKKRDHHFTFRCVSAIELKDKARKFNPKNSGNLNQNYKALEDLQKLGKYTKRNVLSFINENFNCSFTKMEIDEFTLSESDLLTYYNKNE
jgi:hypothetical protein